MTGHRPVAPVEDAPGGRHERRAVPDDALDRLAVWHLPKTSSPGLDDRCPLPLDRPLHARAGVPPAVSVPGCSVVSAAELSPRELVGACYAVSRLRDTIELRTVRRGRIVVSDQAVVTDRTAGWLFDIDVLPRRAVHEPAPLDLFGAEGSRVASRRRSRAASGRCARDEIVEMRWRCGSPADP